jgi:hypothetical protein
MGSISRGRTSLLQVELVELVVWLLGLELVFGV